MSSMRTIVINTICLVALAITGFGCIGTKVHFPDAPIEKLDLTRGRTITGSASGFQLLLLIPIGTNGRHAEAYAALKQQAGNDFITDIKIEESWTWAYVGTVYTTTLTATAYPEKTTSSAVQAQTLTEKLAELKALHYKGELSDAEYEAARKKAIGN